MEKSTHRLMSALLAGMLAFLLVACGGGETVEEGADDPGKMGSETSTSTETGAPDTGAQEVRFGSFIFDNADSKYEVYSDKASLDEITADAIFDSFNEMGAELKHYAIASNSDSEMYLFRFEDSAAAPATTDTIHTIVKILKGNNDIYTEYSFDAGSVIYVAMQKTSGVDNVMVFEIVDNGINLLLLRMEESTSFDAVKRVTFTDGTPLSAFVSAPDAAAGTMRIGNDATGFVEVPADWTVFNDLNNDDPEMLQYADSYGHAITMRGYSIEEAGYDGTSDEYALQFANNVYDAHEENSSVESIESGTQEFTCGLSSYFIETQWDDGETLVQFFVVGDGVCYYVACEGSPEYTSELAGLIVQTFDPAA